MTEVLRSSVKVHNTMATKQDVSSLRADINARQAKIGEFGNRMQNIPAEAADNFERARNIVMDEVERECQ
eukprot:3850868-Pyramimonas_sp.AAC.1